MSRLRLTLIRPMLALAFAAALAACQTTKPDPLDYIEDILARSPIAPCPPARAPSSAPTVDVHVSADRTVTLADERLTLDEFQERIDAYEPDTVNFRIFPAPDASYGLIARVMSTLQRASSVKCGVIGGT